MITKALALGGTALTYAGSEARSTFECTLDGAPRDCGADGLVLSTVAPGAHTCVGAARVLLPVIELGATPGGCSNAQGSAQSQCAFLGP